ncbi:MAG: N-acetylmuramoyl-L-alanine amidase [Limisphaerales bacterium]
MNKKPLGSGAELPFALQSKQNKWLATLTLGVLALGNASELAAQTNPAPQPGICTRACWGARNSNCSGTMGALNRAIIHHTAGASDYTTDFETGKAKVRGIQNYHMNNHGWCDVGYHFLVSAGGHIYEGRKNSMTGLPTGAHDGNNVNSFGFNLMGNYADFSENGGANQIPTSAGLNALYDVIAWRMPAGWSPYGAGTYNGNTVGFLDGHRRVKATACPGNNIYNVHITTNTSGGNARHGVASRRSRFSKPAAFDPNTATWYLRNSNTSGTADIQFIYGVGTDIPVMGDWDGNGTITPGVFRPSTATWYLRNSNSAGPADGTFIFGEPGDVPVVGDWDGDGYWTIGVFRPSNATWYLRNQNSAGPTHVQFFFGLGSDIPVAGDWDGNGTFTPGVFRPSTGQWFLRNSNTGGPADGTFYFGSPGDKPVVGDWNGDGYWTTGVVRGNATRYLSNSNLNPTTDVIFNYGTDYYINLSWR